MAPSASKQKRLAEKAAKASKNGSVKSTPAASTAGDTPAISANGSFADLNDAQAQMKKLTLATDRSAVSCLEEARWRRRLILTPHAVRCPRLGPQVARHQDRPVHALVPRSSPRRGCRDCPQLRPAVSADSVRLGEKNTDSADSYGLLGENGSGKSTFFQSLADRDVEIPEHIDVSWREVAASEPKF